MSFAKLMQNLKISKKAYLKSEYVALSNHKTVTLNNSAFKQKKFIVIFSETHYNGNGDFNERKKEQYNKQ